MIYIYWRNATYFGFSSSETPPALFDERGISKECDSKEPVVEHLMRHVW